MKKLLLLSITLLSIAGLNAFTCSTKEGKRLVYEQTSKNEDGSIGSYLCWYVDKDADYVRAIYTKSPGNITNDTVWQLKKKYGELDASERFTGQSICPEDFKGTFKYLENKSICLKGKGLEHIDYDSRGNKFPF